MNISLLNKSSIRILLPTYGVVGFLCLYVVASFYYPGGSQLDHDSVGFSWADNYWCNLLNERAINGQPNKAQPIALAAMLIICISLAYFSYIFSQLTDLKKHSKLTIQISSICGAIVTMFLFTSFHNTVINVAGLLGLVAIVFILIELRNAKWMWLFSFGIFNIALGVLNNILYYGRGLIIYLPIIQKVTFLSFLLWVCLVNVRLYLAQVKR